MPGFAVAAIVIASIAAMAGNVMPVMAGMLSDLRALDEGELGFVVACGTLAGLVTSLAAPQWIARVDLRYAVGLALAVAALGLLGLRFAPSLATLFVTQILAGAASVVIASSCLTVIAQLPNPVRAYGLKTTTDVVFAGSFLAIVPGLHIGLGGFVGVLAILSLLAAPLAARLPAKPAQRDRDGVSMRLRDAPWSAWLALATIVVFYVGGIGVWVFLERIALHANLSRETTSDAIAIGLFVGVLGSLGAAASAGRSRPIWPESVAGLLLVASFVALTHFAGAAQFYVAVFVFNCSWNFFVPFVIGQIAARDSSGRMASLVPGTVMIGGVFGPVLMGLLIRSSDYAAAMSVMTVLVAASVAGYVAIARIPYARVVVPLQSPVAKV